MDKKTIGVIAACMLLLFLWGPMVNKIWPPIEVPENADTSESTNQVAGITSTNVVGSITETNAAADVPNILNVPPSTVLTATNSSTAPEQLVRLENNLFKLTLTSEGGGVRLIELKKYPRHVNRQAKGDSSLATLNENARLPLLAIASDGNNYHWAPDGNESMKATADWGNGLRVTKEFTLSSNYLVQARVHIENPTKAAIGLPQLEWSLGASTPLGTRMDSRFTGVLWYDGKSKNTVTESWFQNKFLGCFPGTPRSVYEAGDTNVVWAGVQNQFFALLTVPDHPANEIIARHFDLPPPTAADLEANPKQSREPKGHQAALVYGPQTIPAGGSVDRTFTIYAGPKEYNTLSQIAFHQQNKLDLVMNFSGFFGYFAKGLLFSMNGLHNNLAIPYGLTIVLITIIIKTVFWPLTTASTKSMKRMSKLQPQMKAIQEKYKEDPQKMQRKLMEFMKENKVNPMGSCLPLMLQMPIFIGFYTMLQSAIELRGAHFLWIGDLSSPDTLFMIPGLGIPFNLMPIIMGCTMLFQARLTPPSPGMDPTQQTMMKYMPLMFMFILYGMSSGLTLYWTVQNALSILQTKLTRTDDEKAAQAGAAKSLNAPPGSGKKKH
ncbi:membrane protein insertase YidC [bacterium]|nr:membrane protein insertase YidC [bacterium]